MVGDEDEGVQPVGIWSGWVVVMGERRRGQRKLEPRAQKVSAMRRALSLL